MRKITSMLLALALVMSLSVTAFANETGVGTGYYSTEVTGTYVPGTTAIDTVFSVDIVWEDMGFTYHAEKAPTWDPKTHTYVGGIPAHWEGEGSVTVTNHSNAVITAEFGYYCTYSDYEDAYMTFSAHKLRVASAETGSAQTGTITVTPGGSLPANTENKRIGTLQVTIAKDIDVTADTCWSVITEKDYLRIEASQYNVNAADLNAMHAACSALSQTLANFQQGTATQEELNEALNAAYNSTCKVKAQIDRMKD